MTEPLVCCICPTRDRAEFLKQSVECFEKQSYQNKEILILNTSRKGKLYDDGPEVAQIHQPELISNPIGALRNRLVDMSSFASVIAHWDDDDWSCPTRLAEQVAFLQSSGAAVVGYRDMPFYDVTTQRVTLYRQPNPHFALGTSLMYWRKTWEQHPFIETIGDEDSKFLQAVGYENVATQSTVQNHQGSVWRVPRMIARIHPGNTSPKGGARYEKASPELRDAVLSCIGAPLAIR